MFDSLELELLVEFDRTAMYAEAFSVHANGELPTTLTPNFFEFIGGRHLEVLIKPSFIRSDDSLKALKPSERMCYFKGEQKLQFFKTYTQKNCELDRFSKNFVDECGCVSFHFPRRSETKVCGIREDEKSCAQKFVNANLFSISGRNDYSCLSPCDSISYDIKIRESMLHKNECVGTP